MLGRIGPWIVVADIACVLQPVEDLFLRPTDVPGSVYNAA
jgi:hypothetical protein